LAVAGIIEGNFTDEGLAAMSECQDLTTLLAQELTLGIKDEVEDLSEVFKKMAIVKTDSEPELETELELESEQAISSDDYADADDLYLQHAEPNDQESIQSTKSPSNVDSRIPKPIKPTVFDEPTLSPIFSAAKTTNTKKNKKAVFIFQNQISLFDFDEKAIPA
jgi:hypothetical protein